MTNTGFDETIVGDSQQLSPGLREEVAEEASGKCRPGRQIAAIPKLFNFVFGVDHMCQLSHPLGVFVHANPLIMKANSH